MERDERPKVYNYLNHRWNTPGARDHQVRAPLAYDGAGLPNVVVVAVANDAGEPLPVGDDLDAEGADLDPIDVFAAV